MNTPLDQQGIGSSAPDPVKADPFAQDDVFPILDYLQLLWFRRRLIIAITILVGLLGYIHVKGLTSIYSATSSLIIGVQEGQQADPMTLVYQRYFGMSAIEEMEILKSRGLAEKVIIRQNLMNHPEFNPSIRARSSEEPGFTQYLNPRNWIPDDLLKSVQGAVSGQVVSEPPNPEEVERRAMVRAVDIFLSKLSVSSIEYSDVLMISFRSPDPRMATRLANALPEAYILDKLEAKLAATERVTDWLSDQLSELEQKVRDSEQAVELYREQYGLTEVDGDDLSDRQLSSINSQLLIARTERVESEARLAQVQRLVDLGGQGVEASSDVTSSPMVQQLRNQELEVKRRIADLSLEYGPKHPRMLQAQAELDDVYVRIDEEVMTVVASLENEVEFARARETSLEASLAEAERLTGSQNREAVQLRALEREAAANRTLFETFLSRFKETTVKEGTETPNARVLSVAELPTSPAFPNRKRKFLVIVMLGFMGACGLVLGLHFLSPGMFSPEQIEQQLGVHAIGMVPKVPGKAKPHDYVLEKPNSGYVEAINSLKTSLKLSDPDAEINAIQVTSSVPEEGKTSLVVSLGVVLAKGGNKVIIVDGDLRRSSIARKLGLPTDGLGLTDFVIADGDPDVTDFVYSDEKTDVDFMRPGNAKYVSASDLFASRRMSHIVDLLKQEYDYVLIDTPPVMAVADARIIGQLADKTIFVVRWDKTPKKVAKAALEQLRKANIDLAGIVLQQVDLKRYGRLGYGDSGYYYHYGRYGQYYQS